MNMQLPSRIVMVGFAALFLVACRGSIQDRIDRNIRVCGSNHSNVLPIFNSSNQKYTEVERQQLHVQTLAGVEVVGILTDKSCLEFPSLPFEYMIIDKKEQLYSIVSHRDVFSADIQLKAWILPDFSWACKEKGMQLRKDSQIPIQLSGPYALKGQSVRVEIQSLSSKSPQIEALSDKELGLNSAILLRPELENGEYLATPQVENPFGAKIPLGPACAFSVFNDKPRLDVSLNAAGDVLINQGEEIPASIDGGVHLHYCIAELSGEGLCDDPKVYQDSGNWTTPVVGSHFLLTLLAIDRFGNENLRRNIPLVIDRQAPKLHIAWRQPQRNRIGHAEHLPYRTYEAKISATDDISSEESLRGALECRVRLQINSVIGADGSFAHCTQGLCKGKLLKNWTACSPELAFLIDDSFWKQYPTAKELIVETRSHDQQGKLGTDSAMVMIDPNLYPTFTADSWEGAPLGNILDMTRLGPHSYVILRTKTGEFQGPTQLLFGDFGHWAEMKLPENLYPQSIHSVNGRIFASFRPHADGPSQLREWNSSRQEWSIVAGLEDFFMAAVGVAADPLPAQGLWIGGVQSEKAFVRLLPDGSSKFYACPLQSDASMEHPKTIVTSGSYVYLFGDSAFYQLNPLDSTCTLTIFPAFDAPIPNWNKRNIFKDQSNRVWLSSKDHLEVLEGGQWNQIDLQPFGIFPKGNLADGAYRFRDGSLAVLSAGDITFIPQHKDFDSFQFNRFNTTIVNGLPKNSRGEAYEFADKTIFFEENESLLSVKGGILVQTSQRENNFYLTRQTSNGKTHQFIVESEQIFLAQVWGGVSRFSEKALDRFDESSGLPFDSATSLLFENGHLKSVFGASNSVDNAQSRKADFDGEAFRQDEDFLKLKIRSVIYGGIRTAFLDSAKRLWFTLRDGGSIDKAGGNFYTDGSSFQRVPGPDPAIDIGLSEGFFESSDAKVFWRGRAQNSQESEFLFDLYFWTEHQGTMQASGPGKFFKNIYDTTSFRGELWVSGIDQEHSPLLAVYRNLIWQKILSPGDGSIDCLRIGFNRHNEMYCLGLNAGVHTFNSQKWESFSTPGWVPPNPKDITDLESDRLNAFRRFAYFEDGLLWVSRREGYLEHFETSPAPGWGTWWNPLNE